ncbi:MAG: STAS domain-containing protein, partial [Pseudomonadales bacterium]
MTEPAGKILYAEHEGVHVLKLVGDVRLTLGPVITQFLDHLRSCEGFKQIVVDLKETQGIDSTALGLLAKVAICSRESFDSTPAVICPDPDIARLLRSMAMEQVCHLVPEMAADESDLAELPRQNVSEDTLREEVLLAHRTLMSLNTGNKKKFKDLVQS